MQNSIIRKKAQELFKLIDENETALKDGAISGSGEDFFEFREYRAGESVTSIDCRASARMNKPIVQMSERKIPRQLYILREKSASMDFSSIDGGASKADVAKIIALSLSFASGADKENHIPKIGAPNDSVLMVGDFLDIPTKAVSAKSGFVLQILDEAELKLPYDGAHSFEFDEYRVKVDNVKSARGEYAKRINEHCSKVNDFAKNIGFEYHLMQSNDELLPIVRRIYQSLLKSQ